MKAGMWTGCLVSAMLCSTGVAAQQEDAGSEVITLACGGVGADESTRMRGLEKAHALTIIFAAQDGSYLSGVATRVGDPLADLQIERKCGPIGLVDVPSAGRYRLVATHQGVTREQWLELEPRGGKRVVLQWPE